MGDVVKVKVDSDRRTGSFMDARQFHISILHRIKLTQVCMLILHILACISILKKFKKIIHHLNYTSRKFLHDLIYHFFPQSIVTFYFGRDFLPDKAHIHQDLL